MQASNHYNIYPSILDSYTYMRNCEDEELRAKCEDELLDQINRKPRDPNYYAARGTALNELVDAKACHMETQHPVDYTDRGDAGGIFTMNIDTFDITYCAALVDQTAAWVEGMLPQVYCEADIKVPQGVVTLYGYADYVGDSEVTDLKTSKRYDPDSRDYSDHWQHRVYPYCLLCSGMVQRIDTFTYLVAELKADRDEVLDGTLYREIYGVDLPTVERELRDMLAYDFLPWLEAHRAKITNAKIFE